MALFNPEESFASFSTMRFTNAIVRWRHSLGRSIDWSLYSSRSHSWKLGVQTFVQLSLDSIIFPFTMIYFVQVLPSTLPDFHIPLRRTSCDGHILLGTDDDCLLEGISAICNFVFGNLQWIQPNLSNLECGFRIRRASSLALSALFTSTTSTSDSKY